ncbi:MAG: hypothetical protein EXR77_05960 [Myxococcales bacterium]|nr:hypothetical protein [Myxococcales bacterium]
MNDFPSLRITRSNLVAQGAFAESQAAFLEPDRASVERLDAALRLGNVGVVAHFYMDPELQGVLSACSWPHIHISDSLVMADRAVTMAQAGAAAICVAGVDFMSENVRAVLDSAGFAHIPVFRLAASPIGCSLAQAAEAPAYSAFLEQATLTPQSLHVVYINTSLRTKASAHAQVPTITCTSSNVVQTILAAAVALPQAHIWYGPDTYMGENLCVLLDSFAAMPPAEFDLQFPHISQSEVVRLRQRFHPFQQGNCIVHHLFGSAVVEQVKAHYADALLAAHLEVPGEMFALANQAQLHGRGVVGSTSNILEFLAARTSAATRDGSALVRCVLGTEAGMITAIVRRIQHILQTEGSELAVEIIFPVAAEAITISGDALLPVVPGPQGGEGCSTAGGCATCPYMKMNSLDALVAVVDRVVASDWVELRRFAVQLRAETLAGRSMVDLGAAPILHMRAFQRSGHLPEALLDDVRNRFAPSPPITMQN